MDAHAWIAVATLVATIVLFVTRWIPLEATALAIPVVLAATGTLEDPADAVAGFGNLAVIAIGAVFIVGEGLKLSGVATLLARGVERVGGRGQGRLIFVIMLVTCVLSGFMSNAATAAVFLPVVAVLAKRTHVPVSHLMLPLGYAAILGGTLTLLATTPNLILDDELLRRTGEGLGMFRFTLVGLPICAIGILYMVFIGRRLLPSRTSADRAEAALLPEDLARSYGFVEDLYKARVETASLVNGKTIGEAAIGARFGLEVVLVLRPGNLGQRYLQPSPDLRLEEGDILYFKGSAEGAWELCEKEVLRFGMAGPRALEKILGRGLTLAEVTLSPHSNHIGKTLKEIRFRSRSGLNAVSLWRRGVPIDENIGDRRLDLGDAILVSGPPLKLRELSKDPDFVVLTDDSMVEDVRRAPVAAALLLVAILPPLFGWLPLALSAIASALLMVGTGCVSFGAARRAIDFRVLFLIIGTIPLGTALEQRGVAEVLAGFIVDATGSIGPPAALLVLFLLASVLSTTCNNGAAAVILAPVAFQVAGPLDLAPATAFLAVAFGASCVFMLPFGNQCNLIVMGPGGYSPRDFLRVGTGLSIVMAAATVALLSIL